MEENTQQSKVPYQEMTDDQKEVMWDEIADWFTLPKEERNLSNKQLYESYGIPERTFYAKLQDEKFNRLIVKKTLVKAKKFIPELVGVLQKNIYDGKEKSIEMYFKYVAETADKIDHTTGGEKITGFNYVPPADNTSYT